MPALSQDDPIVRELSTAVAGRYALERELGRGGMGAVYLGRDLKLDRLVAIKVLPPELAVRPELRERFLRETRTAASFSHPNIVSVHGVEEIGNLLFFVMTFVEGETLSQRVQRQGPLTVPEATRLLQEVAWALSYAHGRGVVHRDVKPDNILIERATGRAMVMDFGIARSVAASGLTQMGETVGTPHFMSPEQAAGDKLDGRSDLYSLGVVAFYAVTARLPFDADSAQAIMVAHISQPAPAVARTRPDLPAPLAAIIDRCLLKDPEQRFATGEALVEALEAVRSRQSEVPAAIRMWLVRADQFFRNGMIIGLIANSAVTRSRYPLDQLVFGTLYAVIVAALWAQIPLNMRDLRRRGFGFDDLRAGIRAIDEERLGIVAAMRADRGYARRQAIRWRILLLAGFLGVGLIVFAFRTQRTTIGEGNHSLTTLGLVCLMLGAILAMGGFVFAIAGRTNDGRMERRMHGLWTGPIGGFLFRLGTWRFADRGTEAQALPSRHGARTLLDTLPVNDRRQLGKVRVTLERLEGEIERLERREKELEGAMTEARVNAPTMPHGASDRQRALLEDLDAARRAAAERRVAILGALENVRLSLVRVKSRIATVEDTER
ncbi:MAG: serine/threonine-protein kinase, partial [Gemmatimonadota bacterium]